MATATRNGVFPHDRLASLFAQEEPTDGQLLTAFIDRRDGEAFATLVGRHGPMVWGVCRRILPAHDAEDAFQATFLILVRKATTVAPRDLVGNWLYGVARQTALQARRTVARRMAREAKVAIASDSSAKATNFGSDLAPLLDEELSRLPDHYSVVIVLCDLEGLTRKETAGRLGVPEGSVSSRLARARAMLAKRLSKRGVAVTATTLAVLFSQQAKAGVPPWLATETVDAAAAYAAGRTTVGLASAKVVPLVEGVLKVMLLQKLKLAMLVVAAAAILGGVGTGGFLAQDRAGQGDASKRTPMKEVAKKASDTAPKPTPKRETLPNITEGGADAMPKQKGVLPPQKEIVADDPSPTPEGGETLQPGAGGADALPMPKRNGNPLVDDFGFPVQRPVPGNDLLPNVPDANNPLVSSPSADNKNQISTSDGRLPVSTMGGSPSRMGAGGLNALTPEQVFQNGFVGPATVKLAVKAVSLGGGRFSMEEATSRQIAQASDGKKIVSRFRIVVAEPVEARLRQLGVEDLRSHFYGKTVRVAGNVKQEVEASDGGRLVTYTLIVERLDQLQSVGKEAGGGDSSGPSGFSVPMGARR